MNMGARALPKYMENFNVGAYVRRKDKEFNSHAQL